MNGGIRFFYHTKNGEKIPQILLDVVDAFKKNHVKFNSLTHTSNSGKIITSDGVLKFISDDLINLGYMVEQGKKPHQKIRKFIYDDDGTVLKEYNPDAYHPTEHVWMEVESIRTIYNRAASYDFTKCQGFPEVKYCVIAVKNKNKKNNDFITVNEEINSYYKSWKHIPYSTLIIGY